MSQQNRHLVPPAQPVAAQNLRAHDVLVALDIGLSTTKIACQIGRHGEPMVHRLPSRALPISPSQLHALGGGIRPFESTIRVDQHPWVAAIDLSPAGGRLRLDDKLVVGTHGWLAHARAALARLGQSRISELIVGLPLKDFLTPSRRELAAERLVGAHPLPYGARIEVERVTVMPQSFGALRLWELQFTAYRGRIWDRDAPVLVVDCGHRTVSWMLTLGRSILQHCSGASACAGARLQRCVRAMLKVQLHRRVSAARMEWRCRQADRWMDLGKAKIHLDTYLRGACLRIVPGVIHELKTALEPLNDSLDSVVLTGGLAEFFAPAMRAAFPYASLVCSAEPATANARGLLQSDRKLVAGELAPDGLGMPGSNGVSAPQKR